LHQLLANIKKFKLDFDSTLWVFYSLDLIFMGSNERKVPVHGFINDKEFKDIYSTSTSTE
jgi:hypothetical protein